MVHVDTKLIRAATLATMIPALLLVGPLVGWFRGGDAEKPAGRFFALR